MRTTRIRLDELRDERCALALEAGNVFATPEFHETWWRHFGAGRELALRARLDDEGRLVALWPAYVWRHAPVRVERFIGHGGGDELGPVGGGSAELASRWALLVAEHLRPEVADALGATVVLAEQSPVLRIPAHAEWDAYLATRSSNFRQQVRGRTRKLEGKHDVAYRRADASTIDADLDTLFRLHRLRWPGGSEFARHEAFHRDFARAGLARGWTRLVVLEVDGAPAAAWYGFRFGDVDSYYQSGRDATLERESVGLVLLAHTVRAAFEDGQSEYRFLRGDEPYKFRFTDDDSRVVTATAGRGGRAAALAARSLKVSRGAARRLVRSRPRAPLGLASPRAE